MQFVLNLLKSPEMQFNAHNLSKKIGISHMGALKIARNLENEGIIKSMRIGKGIYYTLNFERSYVKNYLKFLLSREGEHALPYIKRWINELKKITKSEIIILFGSVLTKYDKANDIDVLFITDNKNFSLLKKEIETINLINIKKIHPIYQSEEDFRKNMKKDKMILNAIKGIFIRGEELFIELIAHESSKK